ncbi:hypothetical protein [Streptomyces cavernae]|uniref:hypothetical protein n=1 Tax=Streptomyces cavernae TaxID=2259034 RepID=UPI000FEBF96B|nr:hypothetical protein [Streptomyces cavernae]
MIRNEPRPGDILLTTIAGPVGKLIAFGQWLNGDGFGVYQHAAVVLTASRTPDGWAGTVLEAWPGGARIAPLQRYDGPSTVYVSPVGLTGAQRRMICAEAGKYEGTPYSFLDYAALTAHRLNLPAPGLREYINATDRMICSQLADRTYLDAGVHLFNDGRWPGYVTPMDLWDLLRPPADDVLTLTA